MEIQPDDALGVTENNVGDFGLGGPLGPWWNVNSSESLKITLVTSG
jgi:hypothetical protein